jgi:hypothetical protein
MAYGDVTGVLARAGALKAAFADGQPVATAELQQYLDDTSAKLDVGLGAHGVAVPVLDQTAKQALSAVNEDMALLYALDANWPGSSARDDVADLRAAVQARVDAYTAALDAGTLDVLLYLGALAAAGAVDPSGASSFWTKDALTYEWWSRFVDTRWGLWPDPWGVPTGEQPPFRKGMAL